MYRAIALFAMQRGYIAEYFDKESLINSLPTIRIQFRYNPGGLCRNVFE
jgi:cytidylate kinase